MTKARLARKRHDGSAHPKSKAARENPAREAYSTCAARKCGFPARWPPGCAALRRSRTRIGQRNQAVAVVDGVGRRERIAIAEDVIRAQGAEVFLDAFAWDCCRPVAVPLGRPFRTAVQGRWLAARTTCRAASPDSDSRPGCRRPAAFGSSPARLRVRHHADAG